MKLHATICGLVIAVFSLAAVPQKKPDLIIDTEYSVTTVIRDKVDKSLSGDRLVFGTVIQLKKQIAVDNIRLLKRYSVYNCARNEFVIKDVMIYDRDGQEAKNTTVKTDAVIIPDLEITKREFDFICAK